MFVRWKKRSGAYGETYLVRTVRINGKPRHQVITHLCTLKSATMQQLDARLWGQIEAALEQVAIDASTKERIYQAIASKTPRPSPEQIAEAARLHQQHLAKLEAMFPNRRPIVPEMPPAIGPAVEPAGNYSVQWKRDAPARYQVFLVKLTPHHGPPRREIVTRLASIEEQHLLKQPVWSWRQFWYSVHCALCSQQVEPAIY